MAHTHGHDGLIRRARLYDWTSRIAFAGAGLTVAGGGERRPRIHYVRAVNDPGTPPPTTTSRGPR